MKRLIKYWSPYEEKTFSDCSTRYEVLPFVVKDDAGSKELRELAKLIGFEPIGRAETIAQPSTWTGKFSSLTITNTIPIEARQRLDWQGKVDTGRPIETIRLGFITLDESGLEVDVACDGEIDEEYATYEVFNNQDYSIRDYIEIDGTGMILIESWKAFHHMNMLGYSFDEFLKLNKTDETIFDDSVFNCGECGTWDYTDSGYTYNYRIVDGDILGTNLCNCHHEYTMSNFEDRINDTNSPLELEAAEELADKDKIEHVERFIGGMTDGRGGYYDGQPCREGNPKSILTEMQEKYPETSFIFSHDESGQFQTYFSIWRVL